MALYGGFVDTLTYPAATDRALRTIGLARARTGIANLSGVELVTDLRVTAAGGMNVNISAGKAVIAPDYTLVSTATESRSLAVGSSSPRIDLVVARVRDTADGAPLGAVIEVVQGTPAASPTAPAAPARSLPLAQVLVGANVSSITSANITDLRVYTGSVGPVRIPGALASTPVAVGVVEGTEVYDSSAGAVAVAVGGGWLPLGGSRQGAVAPGTVAVSNGSTIGTVTIGPFPVKMDVVVQYQGYGGYRADNASNVAAATTATTVTGSSGHTIIDRGANSVGGGMAAVGYRPVVAGASILGLQAGGTITTLVKATCSGPADNATTYGYQFLSWTATPSA